MITETKMKLTALKSKRRRYLKEQDSREELKYFENAVLLNRDANHIVYLAQAYRETAAYLIWNKLETIKKINLMNEKSQELYKESLELNPSSAAICRIAGNGLMQLWKKFADYSLAKQSLHKAEELSKNPVVYHILSNYYRKIEKDYVRAHEYLQKSASINLAYGHQDLIQMKYVADPDYDALEDLLKAEKSLEFSSKLIAIKGDLGWYYLIFKNDVSKALEYFWDIIEKEQDIGQAFMKKFESYSFCVREPLNMYKVILEKIIEIDEGIRDESMTKFVDTVNTNAELLDDSDTVSLETALSGALRMKNKLKREMQNKHGNEYKPSNGGYSEGSKSAQPRRQYSRYDHSNSTEETKNWRSFPKETTFKKPENQFKKQHPQGNRDDETLPKQNNWRLECRKF